MGDMAEYYDEREDPLDDGYTELAGGWCIPNSQLTGYPFAVRGGIKYPASAAAQRRLSTQKPRRSNGWNLEQRLAQEKAMALTPKQRLRKLESELDSNLTLQTTLQQEEAKLRDEIRKADIPNQPPHTAGNWFKVVVQFTERGPEYTYLMVRNANRWYTTGTSEEQKRFDSWSALCGWLNSTHWHSNLKVLEEAKGSYPTERTVEPPF